MLKVVLLTLLTSIFSSFMIYFLFWVLKYCFSWTCKVNTQPQFNLNLFETFIYDIIFTNNLIFNFIEALAF